MLVLQRKKNQSIIINDNIEVSVLEIGTDWVKLAFNAPKDVSILRKELIEAAKVNREAAKADSGALDAVKKMMKKEENNTLIILERMEITGKYRIKIAIFLACIPDNLLFFSNYRKNMENCLILWAISRNNCNQHMGRLVDNRRPFIYYINYVPHICP